jgi:hypothetical protein
VEIAGPWWVINCFSIVDHCIGRLGEEKRKLTFRILTHFTSMSRIIATNAEDAPDGKPAVGIGDSGRWLGRRGKNKRHETISSLRKSRICGLWRTELHLCEC